jgi:hypothetical protein
MNDKGYYNHPAISGNTVYFTSEDDLWSVPSAGGIARRLTSGLGWSSYPAASPDGRWLAFSTSEEGGPRHLLADGGLTTQPEFAWWFDDAGWNIENRGAEPDIEVEYTPHDYASGRDPQLERGVAEFMKLIGDHRIGRERPGGWGSGVADDAPL